MSVKKIEIRDKASNYEDILYPKTSVDMVDGLQTELDKKASTNIATTIANGLMSKDDKVKLNGIANNANNYIHPSTHPVSMITGLPTSLPANGGNADTVDGKHASDFATSGHTHELQFRSGTFRSTDTIEKIVESLPDKCFAIYDMPQAHSEFPSNFVGTLSIMKFSNYRVQLYFTVNTISKMYYGVYHIDQTPKFRGWIDERDAYTLEGKRASAFSLSTHNHDGDYYKINIEWVDDFNNYTTSGQYRFGASDIPNAPLTGSIWGILRVYVDNTDGKWIWQVVHLTSGKSYIRQKINDGEWTEWAIQYNGRNKPTKADVGLGKVSDWSASSAVNSASAATYATSLAVKTAYDKAVEALSFATTKFIGSGTHVLSDYKEDGVYAFSSACTITDIPTGSNGWLVVYKYNATICKQIWYRLGTATTNDFQTYVRLINGATIGEWERFATNKDIESLKSSVSSGKTAIATAITAKGVSASGSDTHATLANKIGQISGVSYPSGIITAILARWWSKNSMSASSAAGTLTGMGYLRTASESAQSIQDLKATLTDSTWTVNVESGTTFFVNGAYSDERITISGGTAQRMSYTYDGSVSGNVAQSILVHCYSAGTVQIKQWDSNITYAQRIRFRSVKDQNAIFSYNWDNLLNK